MMKITPNGFGRLLIIDRYILEDNRGYFFESFNEKAFQAATGFQRSFVQDNQALSSRNVLRGLHYQNEPEGQSKLLRVLDGEIWDVVVDLRKTSATYGKWTGVLLSAKNKKQFLVPRGFAHGYSVLSETAEILYKCDGYYSKSHEGGVLYNDPSLNIDWKIDLSKAIVSEKDLQQPLLKDCNSTF